MDWGLDVPIAARALAAAGTRRARPSRRHEDASSRSYFRANSGRASEVGLPDHRKYYVRPAIPDAYSNGVLLEALKHAGSPAIGGSANGLSVPEFCAAALSARVFKISTDTGSRPRPLS